MEFYCLYKSMPSLFGYKKLKAKRAFGLYFDMLYTNYMELRTIREATSSIATR
jgi:hypothetical protein